MPLASIGPTIGGLLAKPAFSRVRKQTHWSEVGGCLLLGVNGIVVKGHGRSDANAVANAVHVAARALDANVNQHIVSGLRAS